MIDILFFIAGVWGIIAGKFPVSIIKLLFGKGQYNLSATKVRLTGLLLALPLPSTFLLSIIISLLLGKDYSYVPAICEIGMIIVVSIAVIIIFRTSKEVQQVQAVAIPTLTQDMEKKEYSYGNRLLMMIGIVAMTMFILGSCIMFVLNISVLTGDMAEGRSDLLFYQLSAVVNILVMGLCVFGIVKLVKKMNR